MAADVEVFKLDFERIYVNGRNFQSVNLNRVRSVIQREKKRKKSTVSQMSVREIKIIMRKNKKKKKFKIRSDISLCEKSGLRKFRLK